MQRHPIELGAFHDQHPGRKFILENLVAAICADRVRHSAGHFAERLSHYGDRSPLRKRGAADDSQSHPPTRWSSLFRAFSHSTSPGAMVAAQG